MSEAAPAWQLPVRFFELAVPLDPKAYRAQLQPLLPPRHSPLLPTMARNASVYLALLPPPLALELRGLLAGQLEEIEAQTQTPFGTELADDWIATCIRARSDLEPEQKRQLLCARRGIGLFRSNLERIETGCRVTGLLDRRHLRACHIKPWSLSDDHEKLDGCNGLLLSPHIAHLFMRGYIAFADEGTLLCARALNPAVLSAWTVTPGSQSRAFRPAQCAYLEIHRREIFDRPEIGRRSG